MKYLVIAYGRDCDGFTSDEEYEFDTEQEAIEFANDCNEGSDGIIYEVIKA